MTRDLLADIAGFVGALTILGGFAGQTLLGLAPGRLYHALNLVGASLLALSLTIHFNLPALLLEAAWAAIAAVGLVRALSKR